MVLNSGSACGVWPMSLMVYGGPIEFGETDEVLSK